MTDHERISDWAHIDCPCTTFEQGEDCPVGFPSLLCSVCDGKGVATIDDVVALAAEMLKVAEQVDELADPFAAWETIDLVINQNGRLRGAIKPFADFGRDNTSAAIAGDGYVWSTNALPAFGPNAFGKASAALNGGSDAP